MVNWGTERREPMARFPAFFVPKDVYAAFRAKAKREGVPMAAVLRSAMAAYISSPSAEKPE